MNSRRLKVSSLVLVALAGACDGDSVLIRKQDASVRDSAADRGDADAASTDVGDVYGDSRGDADVAVFDGDVMDALDATSLDVTALDTSDTPDTADTPDTRDTPDTPDTPSEDVGRTDGMGLDLVSIDIAGSDVGLIVLTDIGQDDGSTTPRGDAGTRENDR